MPWICAIGRGAGASDFSHSQALSGRQAERPCFPRTRRQATDRQDFMIRSFACGRARSRTPPAARRTPGWRQGTRRAQPQIERLPVEDARKQRDPVLDLFELDLGVVDEDEMIGGGVAQEMEVALFRRSTGEKSRGSERNRRSETARGSAQSGMCARILLVRAQDRHHQQRQEEEGDVGLEVARADGVGVDGGKSRKYLISR